MTHYGCFEARTDCERCGEAIPINGPLTVVTCSRCFTRGTLLPQRLGELFEDFEEQRPGPEGASQEVVAERGYHFHYRPLEPRCPGCGQSLPEVAPGYDGLVVCSACGRQTTTFPAPAWLQRWAPSAVQFYAADRDEAPAAGSVVNAPQGLSVALSCPSCGAALRVGPERARLAPCEYCHTDVYLADEVWARLHPAQAIRSWYVRFEGVPRRQADAQQRVRDRAEEQVALPAPGGSSAFASIVGAAAMVGIAVAAVVLFVSVRAAVDFAGLDWGSETGGVVATVFLVAALGVWVYLTDIRPRSKSSEKMRALAEKYGLRLEDDCARGVLQGADVTLEPLDHNAVQASLRRCRAWGLFSAPPGHPADGLVRFTSGDPAFDRFFPVRYASPAVVDGLRSSHAAIAPLQWFLGRWGGKLLHLHVDQYALRCNLRRGGARKNSYLPADEMEPLLLDVAALARALDTQAAGQSA